MKIPNKIKPAYLFCLFTLIVVFFFYFRTVFYGLKAYDELVLFKESFLPVCRSFSEMFKFISLLGLNHYFESANTLYSNIVSIRCNPFGNFLQMLIQVLFQKNPVSYHLYSLFLHLINTALVFFILNKVSCIFSSSEKSNEPDDLIRLFFVTILSLFWALHPVNIESVLLLSNANIVLSYTFCFFVFYLYLSSLPDNFKSPALFLVFLPALFIAEFHFMLPFILAAYTLAMKKSLTPALPLIFAVFIYTVLFLLSNTRINIETQPSFVLIFERIFWLSPQVLFHILKLMLFPINLSIDQSLLVKIAGALFDPYAVFCIISVFLLLMISILSFLKATKDLPVFFLVFFLLFLSLIPFSQIPAPLYNLSSERYLYFPVFILIFGFSHFLFLIYSRYKENKKTICLITLVMLLILGFYSARSYIRILDWKDSFSLYNSAINTTKDPLYKAFRYKGLITRGVVLPEELEAGVEVNYKQIAILNIKKAISALTEKEKSHHLQTPQIVKSYGLDPKTLLVKSAYLLSQTEFGLNNDPKKALKIIKPYLENAENISLLDSAGLTFYASLLFHNNMLDEAEKVLKLAYRKYPYSLKVFYSLCDLIQIKYNDLNKIEEYTLKAFKYYPYDTSTLFLLTQIYSLKGDSGKYAHFSHIYSLRKHIKEAVKK